MRRVPLNSGAHGHFFKLTRLTGLGQRAPPVTSPVERLAQRIQLSDLEGDGDLDASEGDDLFMNQAR